MFQAALTVHDIDADSAIWTRSSIITDDRSLCWFSDDDEVSEYVYHDCEGEKYVSVQKQTIFVLCSLLRVL